MGCACDAKWNLGHKCQSVKLYLLEEVLLEEENEGEHQVQSIEKVEGGELVDVSNIKNKPKISLHALT